jgi:site-specific DNA recombinase
MPDYVAAQPLRAAVYARVSSEEQREGQTIDSQIAELERFAREKGWSLFGVYKDEGWSGALLNRPALDRLRDEAAQKKFELVLINDVDRLARDVAHLGIVKRDLERRGVKVIFRKLPSDESPTYNLMVNILGSFAEFEREMIADRTRRGRRHKVEVRQQFLGSIAAYGYRYIPKHKASGQGGYLLVVPEEAALVRQMYEWVDREGLSAHQVAARLNLLQVRPRKGGLWAKSTVLRILRNETYAGVWYYNKHYGSVPMRTNSRSKYKRSLKNSSRLRSRAEWLPVILPADLRVVPRDLWQRVQRQVTKNTTFSPRNAKHLYLLKGLVRCGGCGAAYVGDPGHGRFYYRCLNRCKQMPTVKEERLDATVWDAVAGAILNPTTILNQVSKIREREAQEARISSNEEGTVKRALGRVRQEEARMLEAYRAGIISPAQLGHELEQLRQRQSALEVRAAGLRRPAESSRSANLRRTVEEYCHAAAERLQAFNNTERQRFLRLLIDSVIFEGERVRIRAVIPLNDSAHAGRLDTARFSDVNVTGESVNATTNTDLYGLNSVSQDNSEDPVNEGGNFIDYVNFELFAKLPEKPFSILSDEGLELVRLLKLKWGDPTLRELCDGVQGELGEHISLSAMSRALRRLGMSPTRRGPRPKELERAA